MTFNTSPWPAPAKLNLFLHVTARRADGYHELQTVFQILDWGDVVHLRPTGDGRIEREVDLPGVPLEVDLSLRAARALRDAAGVTQGARVAIDKRIPAGAGLGGASSDAATVLLALNHYWSCGLGMHDLAEIGLSLGADVPLFVHGLSAWAEGVGEVLQPLDLGQRHYLLIMPGIRVSTAEVFAAPDLRRDAPPVRLEDYLGSDGKGFGNDCQPVVLARHPELAELVQAARPWGQLRMTGTGSAFFIESEQKNHIQRAAQALKSRYNVRAVSGVNRSPLLERLARGNDGLE